MSSSDHLMILGNNGDGTVTAVSIGEHGFGMPETMLTKDHPDYKRSKGETYTACDESGRPDVVHKAEARGKSTVGGGSKSYACGWANIKWASHGSTSSSDGGSNGPAKA